ncbi:hypothetical protein PINS_up013716 [Pythium insidiosum]|nr:hypothetical protein PINS_up013716 [Pythium insidiosum]
MANESEYKWTWLVAQDENGMSLLETANIKQLKVLIEDEHEPELCDQLHNVIRARQTAVSELLIEYEHLARRNNVRRPQLQALADALLAPTSALHGSLTRLTIRACFSRQDLVAIVERLRAEAATKMRLRVA